MSKTHKSASIPFSRLPLFIGPKNNWKQLLDKKIIEKIENAFEKEMIELGYL